jgi:hypothetical protein
MRLANQLLPIVCILMFGCGYEPTAVGAASADSRADAFAQVRVRLDHLHGIVKLNGRVFRDSQGDMRQYPAFVLVRTQDFSAKSFSQSVVQVDEYSRFDAWVPEGTHYVAFEFGGLDVCRDDARFWMETEYARAPCGRNLAEEMPPGDKLVLDVTLIKFRPKFTHSHGKPFELIDEVKFVNESNQQLPDEKKKNWPQFRFKKVKGEDPVLAVYPGDYKMLLAHLPYGLENYDAGSHNFHRDQASLR